MGYRDDASDRSAATSSSDAGRPPPGKASLTGRMPPRPRPAPPASEGAAARPAGDLTGPFALHVEASGPGTPLPGGVARQLSASLGADLGAARLHHDPSANAAADLLGAEAFTFGRDIYFGSGGFKPGTAHGDFVIAHEAAHVAQGGGEVHAHLADAVAQGQVELGADHDPAEADASAAAHAVAAGRPYAVRSSTGALRCFAQSGHGIHTERALAQMGLSSQEDRYGVSEVRAARLGNWERDLSQVVLPVTRGLHLIEPIMPILNILALKDFGRPLNMAEFGSYDPVEHIDNPTDLRATGAFDQGGHVDGNLDADIAQHEIGPDGMPRADQPGGDRRGDTGWAGQIDGHDVDPRYRDAARAAGPMAITDSSSIAFSVDQSGIPVYMSASKQLLKEQLHNCVRLGRHGNDGRGPRLFASATHIMQDYYAHSNFAEIAINILLREGVVQIAGADGRLQAYDYNQHGRRVLNTHLHGLGADGRTVDAANLAVTDAGGRRREVMTTGSFNLIDTAASVLEEVKDLWVQVNPFQQNAREASQMIGGCLDYLQLREPGLVNALGGVVTGGLTGVLNFLGTLAHGPTEVAGAAIEAVGDVRAAATHAGGAAASAGLGFLNWANHSLGGDADYFAGAQRAVTHAADGAAAETQREAHAQADAVRSIARHLQQFRASWNGQHGLRDVQMWMVANVSPVEWIAAAAERIPVVGGSIAERIRGFWNDVKAQLEQRLGAAWNRVIIDGTERINGVIQRLRAQTNMRNQREAGAHGTTAGPTWLPHLIRRGLGGAQAGVARALGGVGDMYQRPGAPPAMGPEFLSDDVRRGIGRVYGPPAAHQATPNAGTGIAPTAYNPPSHTEIAKDHADHSNGARDGAHDHADDPASRQEREEEEHGHPGGHDHHDGADHHGHVHLGAWLSPIAEGMSMAATRALGDVVAQGWDALEAAAPRFGQTARDPNPREAHYPNRADLGAIDHAVDAAVERWFRHPEDCRSTWVGFVESQLRTARIGGELLRRIADDLSARQPAQPRPPDQLSAAEQLADGQRADGLPAQAPGRGDGRADEYRRAEGADRYGDGAREAHGHSHGHGHAHGADGHVCAPGCDDHPTHGADGHVCAPGCGDHVAHGAEGHACGPGCGDHAAHGTDAHACGPGCGDYAPHGRDGHQCTSYCETRHAA